MYHRFRHRRTVDPDFDPTLRVIRIRSSATTPYRDNQSPAFSLPPRNRSRLPIRIAASHPDVVAAVMQSVAIDFAAFTLARAVSEVAAALLAEDAPEQIERPIGIVRAQGLVRP